jgi:hypothetical protein
MSTSSIQSSRSLDDLASSLIRRFDVDGNGSLSNVEFSSLLSDLIGTLQSKAAPASAAATSPATSATAALAAASPATRQPVGALAGFDSSKLGDPGHTSLKYQIGRILQFHPSTPAGLQDALAEIRGLVPGVQISGSNGDKLDFGDYVDAKSGRIGVIDVLQGAAIGGVSWQWQPVE